MSKALLAEENHCWFEDKAHCMELQALKWWKKINYSLLFLFSSLCKLSTLQTEIVQISFCFSSGNFVMYIRVPLRKWFDSSHKKNDLSFQDKYSFDVLGYVMFYLLNFSQEIWDVEPLYTTVVEEVPGGEINWLQEIYLFANVNWKIFPLPSPTCLLDFWCCLNKWSNIAPYSSCIRCISLMCSATFSIPIRASIKCWCSSEFGSVKFCNKGGK